MPSRKCLAFHKSASFSNQTYMYLVRIHVYHMCHVYCSNLRDIFISFHCEGLKLALLSAFFYVISALAAMAFYKILYTYLCIYQLLVNSGTQAMLPWFFLK